MQQGKQNKKITNTSNTKNKDRREGGEMRERDKQRQRDYLSLSLIRFQAANETRQNVGFKKPLLCDEQAGPRFMKTDIIL